MLAVDDEPVVRALLRAVLEPAGFRVLEAADGSAALEAAWRERPDAVLLDVGLPGLSGIDVCRALKTDPRAPRVILVSGNATEIDLPSCGADGIVTKPFRQDELTARVRAALADEEPRTKNQEPRPT